MSAGRIICTETQAVVAETAIRARTFLSRAQGLLFRGSLAQGEALVLPQCKIVHMFFMRFPIDVLFLNEDKQIVAVRPELRPWQVSPYVSEASQVVELAMGSIDRIQLQIGQHLSGSALS